MVKVILITFCIAVVATGKVHGGDLEPLISGMKIASKAFDIVCWYEYLKDYPNVNGPSSYLDCGGMLEFQRQFLMGQFETNKQYYFDLYPETKYTAFGDANVDNMKKLPDQYVTNCLSLLQEPRTKPTVNESDAMNDGDRKDDYPFKSFAYCMMNTLRRRHGDKAIEAVKNERTYATQDWKQSFVDEENLLRARHGSQPLKLNEELNKAAQKYADFLAGNCSVYHASEEARAYNTSIQGENLFAGMEENKNSAAYQASTTWYSEISAYPFPYGPDGVDMTLVGNAGHFTQSVWKNSKHVGYGYAFNKDCANVGDGYTNYVVARYFPPGNAFYKEEYEKNVRPLIN